MRNIKDRATTHLKIRHNIFGSAQKPRLAVYRSLNNVFTQLIDDETGRTLVSANSLKMTGSLSKKAEAVGAELAQKASTIKIKAVLFDRGGFIYKGVIKILADAVRNGGIKF